jgi:hypothetical protein
MTPRGRMIYLGVVLIAMPDSLRRVRPESTSYSTSMWIMEFLVLLLIAYEVGITIVGQIRSRRREKRKAILVTWIARGQDILDSAPSDHYDPAVHTWIPLVNSWIDSANEQLAHCSANAKVSFNRGSRETRTYNNVASGARAQYANLAIHLENLRRIIEQPEVYY